MTSQGREGHSAVLSVPLPVCPLGRVGVAGAHDLLGEGPLSSPGPVRPSPGQSEGAWALRQTPSQLPPLLRRARKGHHWPPSTERNIHPHRQALRDPAHTSFGSVIVCPPPGPLASPAVVAFSASPNSPSPFLPVNMCQCRSHAWNAPLRVTDPWLGNTPSSRPVTSNSTCLWFPRRSGQACRPGQSLADPGRAAWARGQPAEGQAVLCWPGLGPLTG